MKNDPSQLEERLQGHPPPVPGVRATPQGGNGAPSEAPPLHTRPKRPPRSDEEPFAMVVLPSKPSSRHSKPLPPPGGAQRVTGGVPIPPPRPEHTLTSRSRPIVPQATKVPSNDNNNTIHVTPVGAPLVNVGPVSNRNPLASSSIMELVSLPTRSVSLTTPRSESEREKNLYTEAPQKLPQQPTTQNKEPLLSVIQNQPSKGHQQAKKGPKSPKGDHASPMGSHLPHSDLFPELDDLVIMSEPGLKSVNANLSNNSESIFCQMCGKCKCEACCRPRKLPQKWLCSGTFLCSKTTVVDSLSCMCCVKGVFYHCTKDMEEEEEEAQTPSLGSVHPEEQPCSCQGPHVLARWATMAMLIPVLPCLLTYPLLRACAGCVEQVYAQATASGCQCQKNPSLGNNHSHGSSNSRLHPVPPLMPEKKGGIVASPESLNRPMLCSSVSALSSKSP